MSSLFGTTIIKGNRLTDFAQSTATVGVVIPFGWGRFASDGNVIFAPLPPNEHVSRKRQGKGGTKTETYTYTLSYAVAFARGPIYGYLWIKRDGKVVYTTDPNAPIEDLAYAAKWLEKATLYYGTADQLPDSTIESHAGSGMVSAFRFLAYIVVEEDDVTQGGGAVPTYEACVIASPPEAYLTSHPYPILVEDFASYDLIPTGGELREIMHTADVQDSQAIYGIIPTGGQLRSNLATTGVEPSEAIYDLVPTGGQLRDVLLNTDTEPSQADYGLIPTGGVLATKLLSTNVQPSQANYGLIPTGGVLS